MRLDELSVELRPRTPWEASELGIALVRRHAGAVWRPWLVLTLAVFVALNALGWAFDLVWLAGLVMWWLKPVFDRIPLYVISRAVFGPAPGLRATLAAQRHWGWKPMLGYLTWRRLGPVRSLYLPIDLLEGGPQPAQRRRVVGGGVRGNAALVTLVCVNFESMLTLAVYVLALMFVPVELLSESARAAWELLSQDPPRWVQLLGNLVLWAATSVVEPFYVGAGFGLYLDRRTRIEAWDVEIAFRRLRARLRDASVALACVLALGLAAPGLARACDAPVVAAAQAHGAPEAPPRGVCTAGVAAGASDAQQAPPAPSLAEIFGHVENDPGFSAAARRTARDPLLHPQRTVTEWQRREPQKDAPEFGNSALLQMLAKFFAVIAEYGLWIVAAVVAIVLVHTRRIWLPWLRGVAPRKSTAPAPIAQEAQAAAEPLPSAILTAVRALWAEGQPRRALALLYRASVAAMAARTGALLVPGATEAQCLRAARALADAEDRAAFARMVRVWQYAAYAERLPAEDDFESLLALLGRRFGWAA